MEVGTSARGEMLNLRGTDTTLIPVFRFSTIVSAPEPESREYIRQVE